MKRLYTVIMIMLALAVFVGCVEKNISITLNPKNMLYLETSGNDGTAFASLRFPMVSDFGHGATAYTLQSSTSPDGPYADVDTYSGLVVGDDVDLSSETWFRLLIIGGAYNGEYSNRVFATICTSNAYQSNWGLDETVFNTGTIAPNVGFGLEASFTVMDRNNNPETVVSDPYTYQWYRVDPNNWESEELVAGATNLTYTTTNADRGYQMLIKATGTNDFQGGFGQIYSQNVVGHGVAITPY